MNMAIEAWNRAQFKRGKSLICTKCGHYASLGGSYSNQGRKVICVFCARGEARKQGIELIEYIKSYVWS